MSEIRPFAALRFAGDPEPRLAPPWDVISEEQRTRLAEQPDNAEAATRHFVEKLLERSQGVPDTAAADTTGARRLSETLGRLFGLKTTRDDEAQGDDE